MGIQDILPFWLHDYNFTVYTYYFVYLPIYPFNSYWVFKNNIFTGVFQNYEVMLSESQENTIYFTFRAWFAPYFKIWYVYGQISLYIKLIGSIYYKTLLAGGEHNVKSTRVFYAFKTNRLILTIQFCNSLAFSEGLFIGKSGFL